MRITLPTDIDGNPHASPSSLQVAGAKGTYRYAFLDDRTGCATDPHGVIDVIAGRAAQRALPVHGRRDAAARIRKVVVPQAIAHRGECGF